MLDSLLLFLITGIIFVGLAIPLILKKVKINNWYGIRVPDATVNEKVWYEVNSIMGRYLFAFGLLVVVVSIHFMLNPLDHEYKMVYALIGILIFGTILFVKLSFSTAKKIANK